jgi:lipopolysaccharide transport system ATP-binding protein
MPNTAIQIDHLSKMYRLGVINNGTFFRDIQTWMAIKSGKEDPHSKIGENKYNGDKDHFWALKDISFEIKQGDRLGIIGKNGAGKSTLLKILSRITTPTEGIIKIKGRVASLLEVGTGFHGELTGRENIYLNGAILGMRKRRIDEKMDEIIAFSGIEQHIDTPVKRYSSGMYVRLAFAVAAHLDSDILIADEVLAVGDAEFQRKALGKMRDLSTGEGRTVLFVSHNMGAVKNLCNYGMILEKGIIKSIHNDIVRITSEYLNIFENSAQITKWINDGSIQDSCFKPISMEFQEGDGKEITSEISSNKEYRIKITFELKTVPPSFWFRLNFVDSLGNAFLFTNPNPHGITNPAFHVGINIFYCLIPPYLFNRQKYKIFLTACIDYERNIIDINSNCPEITINVTQGDFTFIGITSLVAPPIIWHDESNKKISGFF